MIKFKGLLSAALVTLSLTGIVFAQNMPFPQFKDYGLKPAGSKKALTTAVVNQYNIYKKFFRKDGNYCYVESKDTDGTNWIETVSEAHGYGMIITAIMAGEDPEAKTYFDGMYNLYKDRSFGGGLMYWRLWSDLSADQSGAATDGDLDIAYALLLAYEQWGDSIYQSAAWDILGAIYASEIDDNNQNSGQYLPLIDNDQTGRYVKRPSDWMTGHFSTFATYDSDNSIGWNNTKSACYKFYNDYSNNSTGLVPDFFSGTSAPSGKLIETIYDGDYYFNACRVPLRFAMDYAANGSSSANSALNDILGWLSGKCSDKATEIGAGYELNGTALGSDAGLEFLAPFGAGLIATSNSTFMNSIWNYIQQDYMHNYENGDSATAYGEALTTLSMIVMSGNWWKPGDQDTYVEEYIDTNGVILDHFGNSYGDDNAQAHIGACKGVSWGDATFGYPGGDTTFHYGGSYWYGYAAAGATVNDAQGDIVFDDGDNNDSPSDKIVTDNKLNVTFNIAGSNSSQYDFAGIGVSLASTITQVGDSAKSDDAKADLSNLTAITIRYKSNGVLRMGLETEKVTALAESAHDTDWVSDFGWVLPASPDAFTQAEFKIEDLGPETGGSILDSLIKTDAANWAWTANGNANKVSAFGITAGEDADKGATIKLEIEEIILVGMKYSDFGINYRDPNEIPIVSTHAGIAKNNWTPFVNGKIAGIKFNTINANKIEASLYNAAGKKIAVTANDVKAGLNKVMFENVNLSNGRYFVKVKAGDKISTSAFNFVK